MVQARLFPDQNLMIPKGRQAGCVLTTRIDDQLQRLVPQPVAVHASGEAGEVGMDVHDVGRARGRVGRRAGLRPAVADFFAAENAVRGAWPARDESGTRYGPEACTGTRTATVGPQLE